jgi:hypothetical protein
MKWLAWIPAVGFAVAVFLLTSDPVLGAVMPCLLSARKPIESALWLHRWDADRPRRLVNQVFLISLAGWMASLTAFATIMGFVMIAISLGRDPDMTRFMATMLVLVSGLGLCSVSACAAAVFAWRHRVKAWPHPDLPKLCHGDFAALAALPPPLHGFHYGVFVLGTAVAVPTAIAGVLPIALVMPAAGHESAVAILVSLAVSMAFGVIAFGLLSDRILARSPAECWGRGSSDGPNNSMSG